MPIIREYDQKVQSSGDPGRISQVNVGALGAAGRVVQGIGGAVSQFGADIEASNESKDKSDLQVEIAKARNEITTQLQTDVQSGTVNSDDYLQTFNERVSQRLGTIGDTMRTRAGREAAATYASITGSEFSTHAATAKVTADGQQTAFNYSRALSYDRNNLVLDPTQFESILEKWKVDLNDPRGPYANLSAEQRSKAEIETGKGLSLSYFQGALNAFGPEYVEKDLRTGKYNAYLDADTTASLFEKIKSEKTKKDEKAEYALRQTIESYIRDGKDPTILIDSGVEKNLYGAETGMALRHAWDAYREKQIKVRAADLAFRAGSETEFYRVDTDIKREVAEAWVAEQMQDYDNLEPEDKKAVLGRVVEKGAKMGYMFDGISSLMQVTPHGEAFGRAVDTFNSLESFDPYYAGKYANSDQKARFSVYTDAISGGATVEQALEAARRINPEQIAKTREFFRTEEGRSAIDKMKNALADIPWSFRSTVNAPQAADVVMERAKVLLAGNPSADFSTVLDTARKSFEAENIIVNKMWVPRSFADGVPFDAMGDNISRLINRLPAVLKSHNLPIVEGDYVLAPDQLSVRDKKLQVYDPTGFPVPGLRFGADDFRKEYENSQADAYERQKLLNERAARGLRTPAPTGRAMGVVRR